MAINDLIKTFLKGECTGHELEQLHTWLNQPENKEEAETLFRTTWEESSADKPVVDFDKDTLLKAVMDEVNTKKKPRTVQTRISDREPYRGQRKRRFPTFAKVALGLIVALCVAYFVIEEPKGIDFQDSPQITRKAPRGYRNTITLADGSLATLNSESTIRYSKDFGVKDRVIFLEGEAFFDVVHNPDKPFIVLANNLKTTALGTSFNVNAYEEDVQAVSLATGKVKVEIANPASAKEQKLGVILTPGEQAVWSGPETILTKRLFNLQEILSWKDNVIYFKDTDLQSMIKVLEKWYDVEITINGDTNKLTQTGTGSFKNQSLENVLNSLSFSMGFDYAMKKDQILITLNK